MNAHFSTLTPQFDWTDERTNELKKLWADGLSASEIGARMGISRNAVIGKVHRLHLSPHGNMVLSPRQKTASNAAVRATIGKPPRAERGGLKGQPKAPAIRHNIAVRAAAAAQPVPTVEADPCDGIDVTPLLGLGNTSCRWPKGDPKAPGFGFCGQPIRDGLRFPDAPYCAEHTARSTNR